MSKIDKSPYITTYLSIGGWKAVLMVWDDEIEAPIPWNTGLFGYRTQEEARAEAKSWAQAEEIRLVD